MYVKCVSITFYTKIPPVFIDDFIELFKNDFIELFKNI
jgi:hypothetical protein